MADVAVTADAVVNDNFLLAHTQVLSNSMAPNVSLVKLGTVAQTILGLVSHFPPHTHNQLTHTIYCR